MPLRNWRNIFFGKIFDGPYRISNKGKNNKNWKVYWAERISVIGYSPPKDLTKPSFIANAEEAAIIKIIALRLSLSKRNKYQIQIYKVPLYRWCTRNRVE